MADFIYQIYDKIFKKILTLSSVAVVNLINGLFGTTYPPDSTITYHWTEFEDDNLRRILADTILTINGIHSYHIEAQMEKDEDIVFRVFDYGYGHAQRQRFAQPFEPKLISSTDIVDTFSDTDVSNTDAEITSFSTIEPASDDYPPYTLYFPEPKIIYLVAKDNIPDEYTLKLDFGKQGSFPYKVSTFKYPESTPEELTDKKMIILIPFELLKLREAMKKKRTPENLSALKNLIFHDIIGSINKNLDVGNITVDDARKLKRLTHKLYNHIYSHYEEMEELNAMTDESLMLDIDIIEKEHEKQLAEKDALLQQTIAEKDLLLSEINSLKTELAKLKRN